MKKFFALVVSLILILSLTACGGSDSPRTAHRPLKHPPLIPPQRREIGSRQVSRSLHRIVRSSDRSILEEQGYTLKGVDFSGPADRAISP